MRAFRALLVVAGLTLGWPATAGVYRVTSEAGTYKVELAPVPETVRLGDLHTWRLVVRDAEGPVAGAILSVDGGMPMHGHGLPTAPQVVSGDAAGHYRIEGLRFNMPGQWALRVTIDGAAGSDVAILEFQL